MSNISVIELVEIEKFLQYNLGKRIKNKSQRRMLLGKFKEKGNQKVFDGDDFYAYELQGLSATEVYDCYLKYFNYTIQNPDEKERFVVSAEWGDYE